MWKRWNGECDKEAHSSKPSGKKLATNVDRSLCKVTREKSTRVRIEAVKSNHPQESGDS